jgi:hypothetical protein
MRRSRIPQNEETTSNLQDKGADISYSKRGASPPLVCTTTLRIVIYQKLCDITSSIQNNDEEVSYPTK